MMSTNCECQFLQVEQDKWYYILERDHVRGNMGDWRDNADCYGPFKVLDAAEKHLGDNHANPGGWWTQELAAGVDKRDLSTDDVLRGLIEGARSPTTRNSMRQRY